MNREDDIAFDRAIAAIQDDLESHESLQESLVRETVAKHIPPHLGEGAQVSIATNLTCSVNFTTDALNGLWWRLAWTHPYPKRTVARVKFPFVKTELIKTEASR